MLPLPPLVRAATATVLLGALAACGDGATLTGIGVGALLPGGGSRGASVVVRPVAGGMEIVNGTARTVAWTAFETSLAARILWGPCTPDQAECRDRLLPAGERRVVRATEIHGVDRERRDVVVYWWGFVVGRDGVVRVDTVRARGVRLDG